MSLISFCVFIKWVEPSKKLTNPGHMYCPSHFIKAWVTISHFIKAWVAMSCLLNEVGVPYVGSKFKLLGPMECDEPTIGFEMVEFSTGWKLLGGLLLIGYALLFVLR